MKSADTVSISKALDVQPNSVPEQTGPKVRFLQTMGAGDPVPLPDGSTLQFHVPRTSSGERLAYAWFETSDPAMVAALRKVMVEKPWLSLSEVPQK